jgi:lysine 2,3-aminomutase
MNSPAENDSAASDPTTKGSAAPGVDGRVDGGVDGGQPYRYRRTDLVEPDWRRIPGYRDVTPEQWESVQWQRSKCVKNIKQLRELLGDLVDERFYLDLERDQRERATMSMLVPPQMMNTMVPHGVEDGPSLRERWTEAMYADPVRRYMLPVFSDRRTDWPSHPHATRDSLHEHDMWVAEGLTHRYPTKVLAELLPTCPQYCGHCTRMDLVGNSTPVIDKLKFELKPVDRLDAMMRYLREQPSVRDVVVSGGDVANLPWPRLEDFLIRLLEIENIRDIRLATKALAGLPQHWLQDDVRAGVERVTRVARQRGVSLAIHTHVNHANSVTPLVAKASRAMLDAGVRDVRNQGVLLGGINDDPHALLDLCFALLDGAQIMPYYFYMCDMIPFSEHWRVSVADAQRLQHHLMGYLPGFATPRIVCDVPFVGKRWVHQLADYDKVRGISFWTKNYRTSIEASDPEALTRTYEYYDPIHTLPPEGQAWWQQHAGDTLSLAEKQAAASREAAEAQKLLVIT